MSSLADLQELVGFFSYSREDDEGSHGALSALRERIQHELHHLGRVRGQCRRSGCICTKYVPRSDAPKPVNRLIGRARCGKRRRPPAH
jgi:hypothetical protein